MKPYGQDTGHVEPHYRRTRARLQPNSTQNTQHNATMAERQRVRRQPKKRARRQARKELTGESS